MRVHILILSMSALLILASCSSPSSEQYWGARIARVHPGMPRTEVEKILPILQPEWRFCHGSSQGESYWVHRNWKVGILYDYTGVRHGKYFSGPFHSGKNQVLEPPQLYREDMPEWMPIQGIEQDPE